MSFRNSLKWLLFPGLNLHSRLRTRLIPRYLGRARTDEDRRVLDAGCGNGALAYQAYRLGNRVLGVSIKSEVDRNCELFHRELGIPRDYLDFRAVNLYDIDSLDQRFDEIVCTEVMEHIRGDRQVCESLFGLLRPGGTLHLCCPNANHPYHQAYPLDPDESGGHVRPGYTEQSYRELLEPIGFQLSECVGIGGPVRQACNRVITSAQESLGYAAGLAAFLAIGWLGALDGPNPAVPFSLYVRATRPNDNALQSPSRP